MEPIRFHKYQGAGNDFVMIDHRRGQGPERGDEAFIRLLCDRRFGIGADGLILLQKHPECDFEMVYFNADGREGSMCGNGGRCVVAFARYLGLIEGDTRFWVADGEHRARIDPAGAWVELEMADVKQIERGEDFFYLNTGSPHYVAFVKDLSAVDVVERGRAVRYSDRFRAEGTNVNFVEDRGQELAVATYERGVEDETLACGTGVTAAALVHYLRRTEAPETGQIDIQAKGGRLQVRFRPHNGGFTDIWLCGPAERVYAGQWDR